MKKRFLIVGILLAISISAVVAFTLHKQEQQHNEIISEVSKLHVSGNKLVDENGSIVILRGLAYIDQGHGDRYTKMEEDFRVAAQEWKANVIRMPVCPETFYGNPEGYMSRWLNKQVDLCEKYNMHAVIDYHAYDERNIDDLKHFWNIVAPKYANRSHVIYEIMNEPSKDNNWQTWKNNAESIIDLIRRYNSNKVVIINGLDWGYDVSYVLNNSINRNNVVYGSHPYPVKLQYCHTEEQKRNEWYNKFGKVSETYPVVISEFGWSNDGNWIWGATNESYGYPLLKYLDERGIGYFAWNWSDLYAPTLLTNFNTYTASYSGTVIRQHLQEHNGK